MPSPNAKLPLNGFKVLDLTAHRSGPTAMRFLADWGADVIKIEAPNAGVDITGGKRSGPDFQNLHRNKRSLALNLKTPEGLKIFYDMVKTADVVAENMKSDVKYRLKVDYETLKKINPRIVYGSISGFGQDGPYEGRPGVDQIAQGMGGIMSITGHPGGGPVRVGIAINDTSAGIQLASGLLLALLDRERTGEGQWVSTSLLETQIFLLDFQAAHYLMAGKVAKQQGNFHPTAAGTGVYKTSDGYLNLSVSGDNLWKKFCEATGHPELLTDPDYNTAFLRIQNRDKLNARFAEFLAEKPSDHWLELLNKAGVPCGPINTIDKVFADPQVQHLGIAKPIDHPKYGPQKVVGQPIHLSKYPQPEKLGYTPGPGEHTEEVLATLGYDKAAVEALRAKGVV